MSSSVLDQDRLAAAMLEAAARDGGRRAVPEMAEGLLGVRQDKRGNIAFGFCFGGFQPAWVISSLVFFGTDREKQQIGAIATGAGLYIDETRNLVVRQFLESPCEWLWFTDTDIGYPPDALDRLLEATNGGERKVVAGAYYAYQQNGNYATWLGIYPDGLHPYKRIPESGVHKIEACGMGMTLIHRKVCEDIAEMRRDDDDPWVWFGRDIVDVNGKAERTGEDISFCLRAQKCGHAIWGLADLVVEHHKVQPVQTNSLILPK